MSYDTNSSQFIILDNQSMQYQNNNNNTSSNNYTQEQQQQLQQQQQQQQQQLQQQVQHYKQLSNLQPDPYHSQRQQPMSYTQNEEDLFTFQLLGNETASKDLSSNIADMALGGNFNQYISMPSSSPTNMSDSTKLEDNYHLNVLLTSSSEESLTHNVDIDLDELINEDMFDDDILTTSNNENVVMNKDNIMNTDDDQLMEEFLKLDDIQSPQLLPTLNTTPTRESISNSIQAGANETKKANKQQTQQKLKKNEITSSIQVNNSSKISTSQLESNRVFSNSNGLGITSSKPLLKSPKRQTSHKESKLKAKRKSNPNLRATTNGNTDVNATITSNSQGNIIFMNQLGTNKMATAAAAAALSAPNNNSNQMLLDNLQSSPQQFNQSHHQPSTPGLYSNFSQQSMPVTDQRIIMQQQLQQQQAAEQQQFLQQQFLQQQFQQQLHQQEQQFILSTSSAAVATLNSRKQVDNSGKANAVTSSAAAVAALATATANKTQLKKQQSEKPKKVIVNRATPATKKTVVPKRSNITNTHSDSISSGTQTLAKKAPSPTSPIMNARKASVTLTSTKRLNSKPKPAMSLPSSANNPIMKSNDHIQQPKGTRPRSRTLSLSSQKSPIFIQSSASPAADYKISKNQNQSLRRDSLNNSNLNLTLLKAFEDGKNNNLNSINDSLHHLKNQSTASLDSLATASSYNTVGANSINSTNSSSIGNNHYQNHYQNQQQQQQHQFQHQHQVKENILEFSTVELSPSANNHHSNVSPKANVLSFKFENPAQQGSPMSFSPPAPAALNYGSKRSSIGSIDNITSSTDGTSPMFPNTPISSTVSQFSKLTTNTSPVEQVNNNNGNNNNIIVLVNNKSNNKSSTSGSSGTSATSSSNTGEKTFKFLNKDLFSTISFSSSSSVSSTTPSLSSNKNMAGLKSAFSLNPEKSNSNNNKVVSKPIIVYSNKPSYAGQMPDAKTSSYKVSVENTPKDGKKATTHSNNNIATKNNFKFPSSNSANGSKSSSRRTSIISSQGSFNIISNSNFTLTSSNSSTNLHKNSSNTKDSGSLPKSAFVPLSEATQTDVKNHKDFIKSITTFSKNRKEEEVDAVARPKLLKNMEDGLMQFQLSVDPTKKTIGRTPTFHASNPIGKNNYN